MLQRMVNQDGTGCIYKITNLINGKIYIGQTSKKYLSDRWGEHKYNARNGVKSALYNAIRKYGIENFECKPIMHGIPIDRLNYYEILMIKKFKSEAKYQHGYNLTSGGGGTRGLVPWNKGIPRSKETKEKIRIALNNEECLKRFRERATGKNNPMYGHHEKHPERAWIYKGERNPFYGKHHTDKAKQEIREAHVKKQRNKEILMLNLETNEIIKEFQTIHLAEKYLRENTKWTKADHSFISKCAKGLHKYAYGYKWVFKTDYNNKFN